MSERFVIIDLETTGKSVHYGHRIIEVGAVLLENGKIVDKFESLVNPEVPIPMFIENYTGITDEMVANAPKSEEVLVQAVQFFGDVPLLAHNAPFEKQFLNNELAQISGQNEVDILCTVKLTRRLFPDLGKYKLSKLVSHFHLPCLQAHRALGDAEMTAHLFFRLEKQFHAFAPSGMKFTADNLAKISEIQPCFFRHAGLEHGIAAALELPTTYKRLKL